MTKTKNESAVRIAQKFIKDGCCSADVWLADASNAGEAITNIEDIATDTEIGIHTLYYRGVLDLSEATLLLGRLGVWKMFAVRHAWKIEEWN